MTDDAIRVTAGRPTATGDRHAAPAGRRRLPVPSEAIVLGVTVLALLVAAAVADNFNAPEAWALVTLLAFAFIISRGLVKRGTGDDGL
jgi:hypothetical protein